MNTQRMNKYKQLSTGPQLVRLISVFGLILAASIMNSSGFNFHIANPSFEEDEANIGVPDAWFFPSIEGVTRTSYATHGSRAVKFTSGYGLVVIDQQLEGLAGREVLVSFDAAGEDGAKLGVIVAYNRKLKDGSTKFEYSRLTWDRELEKSYQRVAVPIKFAANAVDGRVWFCVYRSNREGTVYLDNFSSSSINLSPEEELQLNRMTREWNYLLTRAQRTRDEMDPHRAKAFDRVIREVREIRDRCTMKDPGLLIEVDNLEQMKANYGAEILQLQVPGKTLLGAWSHGLEQLEPDAIFNPNNAYRKEVLSLQNEYQAMGLTLWNPEGIPQDVEVRINGITDFADELVVRQQVALENWYDKEKTRVADALPLLAVKDGIWKITLPGGGAVRLFVGFRVFNDAGGAYPVSIEIDGNGKQQQDLVRLDASVQILPSVFPQTPKLNHWQCVYMDRLPAARHPVETAKDLAAYYVTDVQFPYWPTGGAVFADDGSLLKTDFERTVQSRWMRAYAPHIDRLWIFWATGGDPFKNESGEALQKIDEDGKWTLEFLNAYSQFLRSWLDYADGEGFGLEHWAILPYDEPKSGVDWEHAPGPSIGRTVELMETVRAVEPDLPIQVTFGNYTLPEDAQAIAPHADIVLPVFPYPERLVRWAPPKYNPRVAFEEVTYPWLQELRKKEELDIWSYKVSRGKKDDLLRTVLAYPVTAVAQGYTGIGYWAYNVTRGSSWDDTDGGILDYSFIYDGTEDHPVNHKYNVTGEVIVPSIRWEALRIGIQDGQILLSLRDRAMQGAVSADIRAQIGDVITLVNSLYENLESMTFDDYDTLAKELRTLFHKTEIEQ